MKDNFKLFDVSAFARGSLALTRLFAAVCALAASFRAEVERIWEDARREVEPRLDHGVELYPRLVGRLPKAKDVVVLRPSARIEPSASEHKQLSWLNRLHGQGGEPVPC